MACKSLSTSDAAQSSFSAQSSINQLSSEDQNQPTSQSTVGDSANISAQQVDQHLNEPRSQNGIDEMDVDITTNDPGGPLPDDMPATPEIRPLQAVLTTAPSHLCLIDPAIPIDSSWAGHSPVIASENLQTQPNLQASSSDQLMGGESNGGVGVSYLESDNIEATTTDSDYDADRSEAASNADSSFSSSTFSSSGRLSSSSEATTADPPDDDDDASDDDDANEETPSNTRTTARQVYGLLSPPTCHDSLVSPSGQAMLLQSAQDVQQQQVDGRSEELITDIDEWNASVPPYNYNGSPAHSVHEREVEEGDDQELVGAADDLMTDDGEPAIMRDDADETQAMESPTSWAPVGGWPAAPTHAVIPNVGQVYHGTTRDGTPVRYDLDEFSQHQRPSRYEPIRRRRRRSPPQ